MFKNLNTADQVLLLVFAVICAAFGYWLSERDRKQLGRTPWGLPSLLWAFFWFLSLILGLVLYAIAHSAGVRRAHQVPPGQYGAVFSGPPSAADQFPAYPRPANVRPGDVPDLSQPAPGPVPTAAPASPPAWHPDPGGRFHYRWWDGREWTSHVSVNGNVMIDTSPDQRIGPY